MKRPITPLKDRVILRPFHSEDQTSKGGIAIPETKVRKESEGEVLITGPDCVRCQPGETVLIPFRSAGQFLDFDGERLFIIRERDLLGEVL